MSSAAQETSKARRYRLQARRKIVWAKDSQRSEGATRSHQVVDCFHTPERETFCSIRVNGRYEVLPIKSKAFEYFLREQYFATYRQAMPKAVLKESLLMADCRALFSGLTRKVYRRIANESGRIHIDLNSTNGDIVMIDKQGWRVSQYTDVPFVRSSNMRRMPHPERGGGIDVLREFLNLDSEEDFRLLVGFLIGSFLPKGTFPLLVLQGVQGSSKTTISRLLQALIDPVDPDLLSFPTNERNLFAQASNRNLLSYDNLSGITNTQSDWLARLVSGTGYAGRKLYSDGDEYSRFVRRPVVCNGITTLTSRPDLWDRAVVLNCLPIAPHQRKSEAVFWSDFEAARPKILGALYDALSQALAQDSSTALQSTPRLADFATWVTAAELALGWDAGSFLEAYERNRQAATNDVLDNNPVAVAVQSLMESTGEFCGTMSELQERLAPFVPASERKSATWPRTATTLSSCMRRLIPGLETWGIGVEMRVPGQRRGIRIFNQEPASGASDPS